MGGVQCDQAEPTLADTGSDALGIGIGNFCAPHMAPPDQDIGFVESSLVQALLRCGEVCYFYGDPRLFLKMGGDGFSKKFLTIGLFLRRLLLILNASLGLLNLQFYTRIMPMIENFRCPLQSRPIGSEGGRDLESEVIAIAMISCKRKMPLRLLKSIFLFVFFLRADLASAQSFQWLSHLRGPVPSSDYDWFSYAHSVSGNGTVVGTFDPIGGPFGSPRLYETAWSWKDGVYTELPFSRAHYISPNARVIIGELTTWNEQDEVVSTSPVRWELDEEDEAEVTVSNSGPIIKLDDGIPEPIPNKSAYQDATGKWRETGDFGYYRIHGVSTDEKTFVGTKYIGPAGNQLLRATVWTENTETIIPIIPGFEDYYEVDMHALAVSGDGSKVVGYANVVYSEANPSYNDYYAFIWTAADGVKTIADAAKDLGVTWDDDNWEPNQATAISSDGRFVAGWGDLDGSNREPWLLELVPAIEIEVNSVTDRPRAANATSCETGEFIANGDRECTLRSAIQAVNAGIGSIIKFDIPGGGVPVITLTSSLPAITKSVKIDATTQQGGKVEVRGGGLDIIGLNLTADENEVRGFVMNGFVGDNSVCMRLQGGRNSVIAGNFLGTNTSGTVSVATSYGLSISDSDDNQIGGAEAGSENVFGSLLGIGVRGDNNKIQGNRIGVGLNNSLLACDDGVGVLSGNDNKIGGAGSLKNYIAAKYFDVQVSPEAPINELTISGNRIGLDGTGMTAHDGRGASIWVLATPAFPIGNLRIEDNKIAGGSPEIWLAGGGVTGASITNNQIGLAFDSPGDLPNFVSVENKDMGIRLDKASDTTISGNTVVGHRFNVIVSGEIQYVEVGDEIELRVPGTELDPPPPGGPSVNVLIENNSIGLSANQKPAGVAQNFGVTVFGNAQTVTLRNNTIAGHSDMEVRLKNGESHSLVGNWIGSATGTDYGSLFGIVINDANQVTIGSDGAGGPNVIGRNASIGIRIQGAAQGTRILNNRIGTNATATLTWANGAGISVEGINDDYPDDTEIRGNVVAGNTGQGIYIHTDGKTLLQSNLIGRNLGGLALPNQMGVVVAKGETSLLQNQIANNSVQGVRIETDDPVTVSKGGIYNNGDSMARDGIRYQGVPAPVPPPNGLVIFRSGAPNSNGKHTVWIGLPSRNDGSMILEIFGNPQSEDEEPQGKTFLLQKTIDTSKPYTDMLEFDSNSAFMTAKSFTATLTKNKATSEFSTIHGGRFIIPAFITFVNDGTAPNTVKLLLGPSELFTLREAPELHGPWNRTTEGESESVMVEDPRLSEPIEFEVWTVPVSSAGDGQQFWRAELDWEKILGEPVD